MPMTPTNEPTRQTISGGSGSVVPPISLIELSADGRLRTAKITCQGECEKGRPCPNKVQEAAK